MSNYKYILIPFITLVLCQITKFLIESINKKELVWGRLFNGSGGMPSTHTSFCTSLTFLIGLNLGFDSPLFAICLVFSFIIMYDAMGLRYESGRQAEMINDLLDEVFKKEKFEHLKEQLGHKPIEVLGGVIFGILSAVIFNNFI